MKDLTSNDRLLNYGCIGAYSVQSVPLGFPARLFDSAKKIIRPVFNLSPTPRLFLLTDFLISAYQNPENDWHPRPKTAVILRMD